MNKASTRRGNTQYTNVGQGLPDNLIRLSSPKVSVGDLQHTYHSCKRKLFDLNSCNNIVRGRFPTTALGNDNLFDRQVQPNLHPTTSPSPALRASSLAGGAEIHGFTLIELLVVVLIIGILAAVALPQYQLAVAKSRFSEVLLLTRDIKQQQEVFFMEHGYYAHNCEELNPELPAGSYLYDSAHLALTRNDTIKVTCSNGGGARVGTVAQDANLELWLDHIERNPPTKRGFCRAKTDMGHKFCAQMGQNQEGGSQSWYYF